ncbi:hypothetical protein [Cytobacillus oceanisediminis]|uniref:hypothetical protein n=1 Tax=Cytobacillus oceanisediminis TaxID=665099 RepID=UPI001FB20B65|nr:hypothetical protein [Cytobacillus oceanisediminis]UOE58046.1 hypothetical protein IRB79_27670 [Cytobacillus oceanisediminis]
MPTTENKIVRELSTAKKCDFCQEEQQVLFLKPVHMAINNKRIIARHAEVPWTCTCCFQKELERVAEETNGER